MPTRRMDLNLTQEDLAERVGEGVRQSEISRLERNHVTLPRRQRMEQLAAALDIPIGILLARLGWAGAEAITRFEAGEDDDAFAPPAEAAGEGRPAHTPEPERTMPAVTSWSERQSGYPPMDAVDSPELHDAIERAESLIAESETRMLQAQTTIDEARVSVRRRQEFRD